MVTTNFKLVTERSPGEVGALNTTGVMFTNFKLVPAERSPGGIAALQCWACTLQASAFSAICHHFPFTVHQVALDTSTVNKCYIGLMDVAWRLVHLLKPHT